MHIYYLFLLISKY